MSLWQFSAAMDGYRKLHDPKAKGEISDAEEDKLWEWMNAN